MSILSSSCDAWALSFDYTIYSTAGREIWTLDVHFFGVNLVLGYIVQGGVLLAPNSGNPIHRLGTFCFT